MKRLRSVLLGVTAALVVTSCLSESDGSSGPTQQEMATAMKTMAGTYTGYMLYSPSLVTTPDTVKNISWTIDSVITIKDFPQSIMAKSFSSIVDSTLLADVKALPATDLVCQVGFYSIVDEGYTLNVIPHALTFVASTSKQTYDCSIYFLNGDQYSMGLYKISTSDCVLMMNTYGFKMDDEFQGTSLFNQTYFKLVSTSKN